MRLRRQINRKSDSLLVGTQNGAASLEESLAVASPDTHCLPMGRVQILSWKQTHYLEWV